MSFTIEWYDGHREPTAAPDRQYPRGMDIDVSRGMKACKTDLPYPAKRCGFFLVQCTVCKTNVTITTAGRADDPRSVRIACRK